MAIKTAIGRCRVVARKSPTRDAPPAAAQLAVAAARPRCVVATQFDGFLQAVRVRVRDGLLVSSTMQVVVHAALRGAVDATDTALQILGQRCHYGARGGSRPNCCVGLELYGKEGWPKCWKKVRFGKRVNVKMSD